MAHLVGGCFASVSVEFSPCYNRTNPLFLISSDWYDWYFLFFLNSVIYLKCKRFYEKIIFRMFRSLASFACLLLLCKGEKNYAIDEENLIEIFSSTSPNHLLSIPSSTPITQSLAPMVIQRVPMVPILPSTTPMTWVSHFEVLELLKEMYIVQLDID